MAAFQTLLGTRVRAQAERVSADTGGTDLSRPFNQDPSQHIELC